MNIFRAFFMPSNLETDFVWNKIEFGYGLIEESFHSSFYIFWGKEEGEGGGPSKPLLLYVLWVGKSVGVERVNT